MLAVGTTAHRQTAERPGGLFRGSESLHSSLHFKRRFPALRVRLLVAFIAWAAFCITWAAAAYALHRIEFAGNRDRLHKYHDRYEALLASEDDDQHRTELEEFLEWLEEKGHCTLHARGNTSWDFLGALFFALTIASGIGYGTFSVHTTAGALVTVGYSLVGLPLFVFCVATLVDLAKHVTRRLPCFPQKTMARGATTTLRMRRLIFHILFFTVVLAAWIVGVGGLFFPLVLGGDDYGAWTIFEGSYWGWITLSTIGFGDVVFGHGSARGAGVVFVLVGIALFGLWLTFLAQAVSLALLHSQVRAFGSYLHDIEGGDGDGGGGMADAIAELYSADELLVAHAAFACVDVDGSQTINVQELRQCLFLVGLEEHAEEEEKIDELLVLHDSSRDGVGEIHLAGWLRIVAPLLTAKGRARDRHWELRSLLLSWVAVGLYIFLGAWVMNDIEGPKEKEDLDHWDYLLKRHGAAYDEAQELHISEMVSHLTDRSICSIPECDKYEEGFEGDLFRCNSYHETWDLGSAAFFCFTVITTIGYGTFTPGSWQGKAFTCGYSLPGLLLLGYALSGLISLPNLLVECHAYWTGVAVLPLEEILAAAPGGAGLGDAGGVSGEGDDAAAGGGSTAVKPGRRKKKKKKKKKTTVAQPQDGRDGGRPKRASVALVLSDQLGGGKGGEQGATDSSKAGMRESTVGAMAASAAGVGAAAAVAAETPPLPEKWFVLEALEDWAEDLWEGAVYFAWPLATMAYLAVFGLVEMVYWEHGWTFWQGCYFGWITFTTIGLGDFMVNDDHMLVLSLLAIPGLALVAKLLGDCDDILGNASNVVTQWLRLKLHTLRHSAADVGPTDEKSVRAMMTVHSHDHDEFDPYAESVELGDDEEPALPHERLPRAVEAISKTHPRVAALLKSLVRVHDEESGGDGSGVAGSGGAGGRSSSRSAAGGSSSSSSSAAGGKSLVHGGHEERVRVAMARKSVSMLQLLGANQHTRQSAADPSTSKGPGSSGGSGRRSAHSSRTWTEEEEDESGLASAFAEAPGAMRGPSLEQGTARTSQSGNGHSAAPPPSPTNRSGSPPDSPPLSPASEGFSLQDSFGDALKGASTAVGSSSMPRLSTFTRMAPGLSVTIPDMPDIAGSVSGSMGAALGDVGGLFSGPFGGGGSRDRRNEPGSANSVPGSPI